MIHIYNNRGLLIERFPKEDIPSFPVKESYSYTVNGTLTQTQQWKVRDGKLYVDYSKEWNGTTDYDTNPEYSVYGSNNQLQWVVKKTFEYYIKE